MNLVQHHAVVRIARLAIRGKMNLDEARKGIALICSGSADSEHSKESLADFTKRAAAAFESDMQPACNAIVGALKAGDVDALRGLRALLPHLLEQINAQPALADLLAHQLGKAMLDGMKEDRA